MKVADDVSGDVTEQTRQTLAKIDALLAEAGSTREHILSAQVFLRDMHEGPRRHERGLGCLGARRARPCPRLCRSADGLA